MTNTNLELAIQQARFRSDLYSRLAGFQITLPPLEQRSPVHWQALIAHFVNRLKTEKYENISMNQQAVHFILGLSFPRNVRQLRDLIFRAGEYAQYEEQSCITVDHLQQAQDLDLVMEPEPQSTESLLKQSRELLERQTILSVLGDFHWNKNQAADKLGISRMTLYKKIKKYNIPLDRPR